MEKVIDEGAILEIVGDLEAAGLEQILDELITKAGESHGREVNTCGYEDQVVLIVSTSYMEEVALYQYVLCKGVALGLVVADPVQEPAEADIVALLEVINQEDLLFELVEKATKQFAEGMLDLNFEEQVNYILMQGVMTEEELYGYLMKKKQALDRPE